MLERAGHEFRSRIDQVLCPFLAHARRVCLIDPPSHPNVGDSAILLGELDFLRSACPDAVVSFYDCENYTPAADRFIDEADVILLHGGGNFGDLWPHHHDMRLRILQRFPRKPVIQLPQSLSFHDRATLERTRALIDRHAAFTLTVRDRRSLAFAEATFDCHVALSPDMAFAMRPVRRLDASIDCLCLLRTDKERVADHAAIAGAVRDSGRTLAEADWLDETGQVLARIDRLLRRATRRSPGLLRPAMIPALRLRRAYAAERLAHGIGLLSRGRTVVADRLHAMIISTLLGIPCVALDSADGKISAFHEAWFDGRSDVRMARSAADLSRILGEMGGP